MPASETFVIAGGGLAGAKAAEALLERGLSGRIALAAEEEFRLFERPPPSKDYLIRSGQAASPARLADPAVPLEEVVA